MDLLTPEISTYVLFLNRYTWDYCLHPLAPLLILFSNMAALEDSYLRTCTEMLHAYPNLPIEYALCFEFCVSVSGRLQLLPVVLQLLLLLHHGRESHDLRGVLLLRIRSGADGSEHFVGLRRRLPPLPRAAEQAVEAARRPWVVHQCFCGCR